MADGRDLWIPLRSRRELSAIEKIIDQLPYGDGAIRRRLITGLIFIAVLSANYLIHTPSGEPQTNVFTLGQLIGFEAKDLLDSPQVLFLAVIIVFAFGSILDAMIDAYIVRGVSITLLVWEWLTSLMDERHWFFQMAWWVPTLLLAFILQPAAIFLCTVLNSLGLEKLASLGLTTKIKLSEPARRFYKETLSASTQAGLDQLYGDQSASAWQRLMDRVPDRHRPWAGRLNARNHDLASFIASAILALTISYSVIPYNSKAWLSTYIIIFLLSYLFAGSAKIVRRSTVSVLELAAESQETTTATEATQ